MSETGSMRRKAHNVVLEERKKLSVSGVVDVDSFDEETITAVLDEFDLIIRGSALHISQLNVESGEMTVDGEITSLAYVSGKPKGGIIKRLFR